METMQAITKRRSTRSFDSAKPIAKKDLEAILAAGCAAPVGGADYGSLHLSAITDAAALDSIAGAARQTMKTDGSPLYGATAFVLVSAAKEQKAPHIELANAACIIENIALAAADLGIDSVYIWGATAALAANRELWARMGVPEGFTPVSGAALGYGTESPAARELTVSLSVNYV